MDFDKVIESWQTKLLQLDRRNSLLYFRQRSSIGLLDTSPDELLGRLQRSRTGLVFTYAEQRRSVADRGGSGEEGVRAVLGELVTDVAPVALQKRLLNLHRRDREWEEEQGINVLFLALGFLHWVDQDGESAKAPLLLVPADLERSSPRDPWRLKLKDDELQINETLRFQLTTFGVALEEYESEVPSIYLQDVGLKVAHKAGWRMEPAIALATFPFAKMAMWEDLGEMRRKGSDHPVIRALAGDDRALLLQRNATSVRLPQDEELIAGGLDRLLPVKDQFTVLPADHSQLRAIELARRGGHLVVHGPPGTGKSQTIANAIATLLADGKRVLFVSEKTAALDVVKKRLTDCELGCFCLDLHSSRGQKASVYQQLREALEARRTGAALFPLTTIEAQRERLNAVARALHEKRSPLGLSVFEVHGRFAQVRSLPHVDFPLSPMGGLSADALSKIREATLRIARRENEFDAHRTSPWRSLRITGLRTELADEIQKAAVSMREAVTELRAGGDAETREIGLPLPEIPRDVEAAAKIVGHMARCPGVPESWLSRDALTRLDQRARDLAAMQSDRIRLAATLEPFFGSDLPALDFDELSTQLGISFDSEQRLSDCLGPEWGERLCPHPGSCEQALIAAADRTRRLCESAAGVARVALGSVRVDRLSEVRRMLQRVRAALDRGMVPESWFEPNGFAAVQAKVEQARFQLAELQSAELRLLEYFEEGLLELVSQEMLVRYRTDHQSPWRIFKKSFRADQRILRGSLRRPRRLHVNEATDAVQSALQVRVLRDGWLARQDDLTASFGPLFSGRTTEWEAVSAAVRDIQSLTQSWEWGQDSARRCLASPETRTTLQDLVRNLEASLVEWEADALASREPSAELDLTSRLRALTSGAEVVSRLAASGAALWCCLRRSPISWSQMLEILSWARQLRKIQTAEEELAPALRKDFEGHYVGPDSDWRKVQAAIQWTNDLLKLTEGRIAAGLAAQCRQPSPMGTYLEMQQRLTGAIKAFRARASHFSTTFDPQQVGWNDWESQAFDTLLSWLEWIEQHADSAPAWLDYTSAVRDLERLLDRGAVDVLRSATDDASRVPELVLRRVYAAWLDHIRAQDPRLDFQPLDHEALREEFRKLDKRFSEANRARVRERCFRRYPDDNGSAIEWGQRGILNRQLSLKRRQLPVRRLIQQIPQLLQALKPCILLSPIAVSQYLSRNGLATDCLEFDAVIFDEASQIFPQDAVPAIARAKQVIVVGDQEQLPPTSFFRRDMEDEDDDEELTEDRLEGAGSILDVMVGMAGAGVHRAYLGMHYRSRHDELIRYSNHHFYEDRLLVFPSPIRSNDYLGLKDVYLPSARYDAGASRTNRMEAEAAVDHVFELLRIRPADESVGVVTLSRSQADLIEELINERRLHDPSLDARFASDTTEPFFVKNLENVQGDERDHVILSIGYGPTVGSGSVPNRFGPINQDGGKRRLNVAVTRAKRSLTVIRSLRPEQIVSEAEGSRLLRRFLEYLQDPARAFEQRLDVDPAAETESPFEEAVYRALLARGHRVSKQVGCFGYRVDLAIASEDGSRYDLGIECDGATYHRAPAARDRDWLRQEVLEGLGWTIHRIWSTDWIRDPGAQINAVERALERARAKHPEPATKPTARRAEPFIESVVRPAPREERRKGTAASAKEFRFAPYRTIDLGFSRSSVSLVDEHPQKLRALITRIVEAEGPVHIDVVIDRIRRHYRAGRAGSQIHMVLQREADTVSSEGRICWRTIGTGRDRRRSSFLDVADHPPRPEPRGPAEDGSDRPIEQIWPGEIEAGVLRVIATGFGVPRDEAVVAVARAFGYARSGPKIQEAIRSAIESLIASGAITDSPSGLTPA